MIPCCLNCGNEKIENYHFCIRCGSELSDIAPLQILAGGMVLDKRYKIDSLLRESDGGIVYKAEDTRFKTLCVVKELFLNYGEINDFKNYVEKIREEINLFCNSRHPCIPVITNYFVEKGRHYLVMDYFEGKSLKSILEDRGNPGLLQEDVKSWTMQILDMLDYAHHQEPPIIYRDINPDNIMIKDNDHRVVFLDFYLSSSDPEAKAKGILPAGDYSAPEEKKGEFGFRSDIFALGATVYYLLTGKSENFSEGKFPPLKNCISEVNGDFVTIIEKSLSFNQEERYESAQEMKEELLKTLKVEKNNHEINSLSRVTSLIEPVKPSVIELPDVTRDVDAEPQIPGNDDSDKDSVKTGIMQSARTKQFQSFVSETTVTEKPFREKDELIEQADKNAKTVKNIIVSLAVILALAFIYLIYWIYNTTVSQTLFNDGLLIYSKACDGKSDYLNSQGKGSYTDPVTKYKEAIMKFDDYTGRYNKDPKGYYMMGHSYFGIYELDVLKHKFENSPLPEEELPKAIEAFKRAVAISPAYVEGHYYLARCYYQQGNWIKSREELDIARKALAKMINSKKKATWKDNIDKAAGSFLEPVYVSSSSSVEFFNNTDKNINIEINGETLDSISLLGGKTTVKALKPGEYKITVSYQEYSFTDRINLEANKGYLMKLKEPSDTFVNFDLHSFRKEK